VTLSSRSDHAFLQPKVGIRQYAIVRMLQSFHAARELVRNIRLAQCSVISDAKMKNKLNVAEKPRYSGATLRFVLLCHYA